MCFLAATSTEAQLSSESRSSQTWWTPDSGTRLAPFLVWPSATLSCVAWAATNTGTPSSASSAWTSSTKRSTSFSGSGSSLCVLSIYSVFSTGVISKWCFLRGLCFLVPEGWGGSRWLVKLTHTWATCSRHNTSRLTEPDTLLANYRQRFSWRNLWAAGTVNGNLKCLDS